MAGFWAEGDAMTTCPDTDRASGDTVTILRARGRRLSKLILTNGDVIGYDAARIVDLFEHPTANLDDLARLLRTLAERRDCCLVRAAIADPPRAQGVRRLLHADPETGEMPTLRPVARYWLGLDMDSVPAPHGLDPFDLAACGRAAVAVLPPAFHDAAALVAPTASHTLKPGLRLRLWFWLARPLTTAELKTWLRGVPVDHCVFAPVQPIYTARPLFIGRDDPLRSMFAHLPGGVVHPPSSEDLQPPPAPPPQAPRVPMDRPADAFARAVFEGAVRRIQAASGRHPAIVREACNLFRLIGEGRVSEADACAVLRAAARSVGKDDAAEIDKIISWAARHPITGSNDHGR